MGNVSLFIGPIPYVSLPSAARAFHCTELPRSSQSWCLSSHHDVNLICVEVANFLAPQCAACRSPHSPSPSPGPPCTVQPLCLRAPADGPCLCPGIMRPALANFWEAGPRLILLPVSPGSVPRPQTLTVSGPICTSPPPWGFVCLSLQSVLLHPRWQGLFFALNF
eukprot:EG_transcript_21814